MEEERGKVGGMLCVMLIVGSEWCVGRESGKGSVVTAGQILTCVCCRIVLDSRYYWLALLSPKECHHLQMLASLCPLFERVL